MLSTLQFLQFGVEMSSIRSANTRHKGCRFESNGIFTSCWTLIVVGNCEEVICVFDSCLLTDFTPCISSFRVSCTSSELSCFVCLDMR